MIIETGKEQIVRDSSSVVTVGVFDGIHTGHRALIRAVKDQARRLDGTSTIVSFDPHPRSAIFGENVPLLATPFERALRLRQLEVDRLVVWPFSKEFATWTAERYITEFLLETVGMKAFVIGYDHRFGSERQGDFDTLRRMGEKHSFAVHVIPEQKEQTVTVSSSVIRTCLRESRIQEAISYLGDDYLIHGTVVRGAGRGRNLGFRTANLFLPDTRKLLPGDGVYAVTATISGVKDTWFGMMNIGYRPTFQMNGNRVIEIHLFNFEREIYGEELVVGVSEFVRPERHFGSPAELTRQLEDDKLFCMSHFELIT